MTRLTDRHHDALESLVRRLDPSGTATIGDLDLVAAEISDLDLADLDRIGSPALDADPADRHPALAFVEIAGLPEHVVDWHRRARPGDVSPSWDHTGLAFRSDGTRWPEYDLDPLDAPAPQRRSVAPEGPEAAARHSDPGHRLSAPSASPAATTGTLPPIVRRRLAPEDTRQ